MHEYHMSESFVEVISKDLPLQFATRFPNLQVGSILAGQVAEPFKHGLKGVPLFKLVRPRKEVAVKNQEVGLNYAHCYIINPKSV